MIDVISRRRSTCSMKPLFVIHPALEVMMMVWTNIMLSSVTFPPFHPFVDEMMRRSLGPRAPV